MFQPKTQRVFLLGQRRLYGGIVMVIEYLRPAARLVCDSGHGLDGFLSRNQRLLSTSVPNMYILTEFTADRRKCAKNCQLVALGRRIANLSRK
jgi:hypothetical protein